MCRHIFFLSVWIHSKSFKTTHPFRISIKTRSVPPFPMTPHVYLVESLEEWMRDDDMMKYLDRMTRSEETSIFLLMEPRATTHLNNKEQIARKKILKRFFLWQITQHENGRIPDSDVLFNIMESERGSPVLV